MGSTDRLSLRDVASQIQERKRVLDENRLFTVSVTREENRVGEQKVERKVEQQRDARPDEFLRKIKKPRIIVPDPVKDFGMYRRMDEAMDGLHDHLERLRQNYGRVGYVAQNMMSDLTKAYIHEAQVGDEESEEEMAFLDNDMERLSLEINEASARGEIAETGNRFSRTIWQERLEADLFGKVWPVMAGKSSEVPPLVFWKSFKGNPQAYLYGFLDTVSEIAKALDEEFFRDDMTVEEEFNLFLRYLAIASSITLRLSQERHVPGYIINNGYGPWMAYTRKLRTAYGTIAHVRREYNLRRSMERMIQKALERR